MPRKFYRRPINYRSKDKYSVENKAGVVSTGAVVTNGYYQQPLNIVPQTSVEGMRKVKHTTVTLTARADTAPIYYALVYVPEGYSANALFSSSASLYEPNQFVMQAGVMDASAGPIRIRSPISRNLNSGDSIWLIYGSTQSNMEINYFVRYAITLQ